MIFTTVSNKKQVQRQPLFLQEGQQNDQVAGSTSIRREMPDQNSFMLVQSDGYYLRPSVT